MQGLPSGVVIIAVSLNIVHSPCMTALNTILTGGSHIDSNLFLAETNAEYFMLFWHVTLMYWSGGM
jgi:hypothetical protein